MIDPKNSGTGWKTLAALGFATILLGCSKPQPIVDLPRGAIDSAASTFFVATNGNDHWSGLLPAPNRKKTDGPFATMPRGLQAVRELRAARTVETASAGSIFVRGGTYFLTEPLVLKPQDSNLTISAYRNEKPIISGGRRVQNWKEILLDGRRIWSAAIPDLRKDGQFFRELWVDGRRAVRARHPNRGYLSVESLPDPSPEWTQGHSRFRFRAGDLRAWKTVTNAELIVMSRWVESRLPILNVDESNRIASFSKRSVFELAAGDPYYVEGALELLDEPGEWYLERASATLYYQPRPGELINPAEVIAPVLTQVLRLEGNPIAEQFVQKVHLRGLTFSHTEWCFPEGFQSGKRTPEVSPAPRAEVGGFAQAAIGVPGAIWGDGARECVFENCAITHVGNYGVELARGCQNNRFLRCTISDLGAGGLKIGETSIRANPSEQTRANEVLDCRIYDGGKMFHSAIGVWIGQSPDNRIVHNLIHDFYYTGISIGWTWGYGPALATNNTVAFNQVHHIGIKSDGDGPILSDMGGIYTLGKQPGTRIVNNLWHDVAATRYGGWGIYFDEGSSGILAESNVVYRTTHGGFHQHYGETNLVRNNIFAFARDHQIQRTRPEPHLSFTFETNLVYFDSGVLLTGDWAGDNYRIDHNLYFDARPDAQPNALRLGPGTLAQWRERGHDRNSVVADPLFVAPSQYDFRLKPNSPALKLGFQPIDLTQTGVRPDKR